MRSPFFWVLVVLAGGMSSGAAQDKSEKTGPSPNEVEARFVNGSVVHMLLLQDSVEIATRFGRLKVPIAEIQRIEFGMHLPEGMSKKVEEAIKRLGSDTFKEREAASNELVGMGAHAYPAVRSALKSSDLEVARLAETVLKRIREKVSAEQLNVKGHDLIQTPDFTIAGQIETKLLKARSPYFGDQEIKITDLRAMRWLAAGSGETEVAVDASKHAINDQQWLDTGLTLSAEVPVKISAAGQVDLRSDLPGRYVTGPAGNQRFAQQNEGHPPGALLGRIGESGTLFLIGDRYEGKTTQEGKLYLRIAPSPWGERVSGSYKVKISSGF